MILNDANDIIGFRDREPYGSYLPIAQHGLPNFNLRSGGGLQRQLDANEQSREQTQVSVRIDRAVGAVFERAQNLPLAVSRRASGLDFAPAVMGRGGRAFAPGSNKTLKAMMMPVSAAAKFTQSYGPGLTPPSPFSYGSRAGVRGAVPTGFRGLPSPISGRVEVRGRPSRRAIYRGE